MTVVGSKGRTRFRSRFWAGNEGAGRVRRSRVQGTWSTPSVPPWRTEHTRTRQVKVGVLPCLSLRPCREPRILKRKLLEMDTLTSLGGRDALRPSVPKGRGAGVVGGLWCWRRARRAWGWAARGGRLGSGGPLARRWRGAGRSRLGGLGRGAGVGGHSCVAPSLPRKRRGWRGEEVWAPRLTRPARPTRGPWVDPCAPDPAAPRWTAWALA